MTRMCRHPVVSESEVFQQFLNFRDEKVGKETTQTEIEESLSSSQFPSNQEFSPAAAPLWAVVRGWKLLGFLTQLIDQNKA